jgi:transposase-like protein
MPIKPEELGFRVGKENDRRRKLDDNDIKLIKELYQRGYHIRALARKFGVYKEAIKWHLFPEKRKKLYERAKLKDWYYDREKHKIHMRRYRQHLKELWGRQQKFSKIAREKTFC